MLRAFVHFRDIAPRERDKIPSDFFIALGGDVILSHSEFSNGFLQAGERIMRFVGTAFLATTILMSSTTLTNADVKVIASIKPVHSLVAAVMDGIAKPDLLVEGAGSPHTYSLKPHRRKSFRKPILYFG